MIVSSTPDVRVVDLDPADSAVILGSDGLWDVLQDSEAAHIVHQVRRCNSILGSDGLWDVVQDSEVAHIVHQVRRCSSNKCFSDVQDIPLQGHSS
jgi:serine/threonine protein phosphatase PrpC